MSNVKLHIGGREFTVACAPGEEEHVRMLAHRIDEKIHATGGAGGSSDSRMLLFAALLLADEAHELRNGEQSAPDPELVRLCEGVETAAQRIEKLADDLEQATAGT